MSCDWPARAACKGKPQRWWFPNSKLEALNANRAKEICSTCPVQEECLQFALNTNQQYGIWGGCDRRDLDNQRKYRVIYCNGCGRRFAWIPGVKSDKPPHYCSAVCRNQARRAGRRASYARRPATA